MRRALALIAITPILTTTLTVATSSAATTPAQLTAAQLSSLLPRHSTVVAAMKRAADYYRPTYPLTTLKPKNGWSWATYAQGEYALYRSDGDTRYLNDGLSWGKSNGWGITTAETNPDTMKAGQTYFDLNSLDATASLTAMDAAMARDLNNLPISQYDWIDALFMGLPDWTRWAARSGNSAYLDKMDALYVWTRDKGATSTRCAGVTLPQQGLYDAAERLWYRDCTYVSRKDANGSKIFWARGNGWVIAAMAQVLQTLPPGDPRGAKYADMLKSMASRLVQLQGSEGFWRSSLVDPALYTQPETSGTALITYALAYGIRAGLLDPSTYLPAVAKAWQGLTGSALQSSGFLRYCQGPGVGPGSSYTSTAPRKAPTSTSAGTVNTDSSPYCVGGFLLAGAEIAQLTSSPSTGRPVTFTSQQTGNEARRVNDGDVTTRWSASKFPQTVTIDLGATYALTNAMVVPYLDRAYRYRIQFSTDKTHWRTVVDRTANKTKGTLLDEFTAANARYVRLTVTGVYGVSTTWASIQEFAVYDRYRPQPVT